MTEQFQLFCDILIKSAVNIERLNVVSIVTWKGILTALKKVDLMVDCSVDCLVVYLVQCLAGTMGILKVEMKVVDWVMM